MLTEALKDLKDEVIAGATVAESVAEIAKQHGLNPALVSRKFFESHGTEEACRATAAATDPNRPKSHPAASDWHIGKVASKVAEACKAYNVDQANTRTVQLRGKTYTVICRFSNARVRQLLAVSHEDGKCYRVAA